MFGTICTTYLGKNFKSFLPQVLSTAAFLTTFSALSSFKPKEDNWIRHAPEFLCLQIKTRSSGRLLGDLYDDSSSFSYATTGSGWSFHHQCVALSLNSESYWDDEEDDQWAWAIRLAALIAIFIVCLGGLATIMLWSATCFAIPAKTLSRTATALFVCAPLSLLTLIAGATSLCNRIYPSEDNPSIECKRRGTGVHLAEGGTLMIFGAFFYVFAAMAVRAYEAEVSQEQEHDDGSLTTDSGKEERVPLVEKETHPRKTHPPPVIHRKVEHTPAGTTVTREEVVNPDGSKTITITKEHPHAPPSPTRKGGSPRVPNKRRVAKHVDHNRVVHARDPHATAQPKVHPKEHATELHHHPEGPQFHNKDHPDEPSDKEETSKMIKVVAPSDLEAGSTFDVMVDDAPFTVVVPKGGVKEAEAFEVPYGDNENIASPLDQLSPPLSDSHDNVKDA